MKSPHAPPLRGSLPPEGADPAWGGPAPDRASIAQPKGFDGFEGSYLGNREVLNAGSRLECKICWWVYDPALGDPQWQVQPGTPFADLPSHWRCPNCDCEPDQFLLLSDA